MKRRLFMGIFLLLLTLLAGCAGLPPRFQESGLNTDFSLPPATPFAVYVQQTRNLIETSRLDINEVNQEAILTANTPFELQPDEKMFSKTSQGKYKKGVLLVHGLSDSPYLMRSIAKHLQSRGFLVRTILLPGHGTVPGDLLKVNYQAWVKATDYGIRMLRNETEQVYMGGFSTGGALSVFQALQDNNNIKGLFLFSPALAVKDKRAAFTGIFRLFQDWVGLPQDDVDYAKYESFTVNAAYQIYLLTEKISSLLEVKQKLDIPVFAAFSEDDLTVDAYRTLDVLRQFGMSTRNMVVLYTKNPHSNLQVQTGQMIKENSYIPGENITDFSHIAITIPPEDPHYGRQGGYKSCLHYGTEPAKKAICRRGGEAVWQGEITEANMKERVLRRLTYNPHYAKMMEHMDEFLKKLEGDLPAGR